MFKSHKNALAQRSDKNEPIKYYINCDLRYFNLGDVVDALGSFDGIIYCFIW